jgi:hypothetical protein
VIDWAIQAHGAAGLSDDFTLAYSYTHVRTLRFADGPDEVHRNAIAKLELRKYKEGNVHEKPAGEARGTPSGLPKRSDWQYTEEAVAEPGDGQFLVKVSHLSLDPAMRGWMNEGKSYIRPVGIGEVMRAGAAGKVIASKHPKFKEGDVVTGGFGVQEYAVSDGKGVVKVDTRWSRCRSTWARSACRA